MQCLQINLFLTIKEFATCGSLILCHCVQTTIKVLMSLEPDVLTGYVGHPNDLLALVQLLTML